MSTFLYDYIFSVFFLFRMDIRMFIFGLACLVVVVNCIDSEGEYVGNLHKYEYSPGIHIHMNISVVLYRNQPFESEKMHLINFLKIRLLAYNNIIHIILKRKALEFQE